MTALWVPATGCARAPDCGAPPDERLNGAHDGVDASRTKLQVRLVPVAVNCGAVTDIQFPPGQPDLMIVLDQAGTARWVQLGETHSSGTLLTLEVEEGWEQGLLGLAFHPKFAENGRLFVNYTMKKAGRLQSRVQAFQVPPGADLRRATPEPAGVVFELAQPYTNHNAGSLVFGPDGMLYIGWGDGGQGGDPHNHGQTGGTFLGTMLRIDVDGEPPYVVPADNPRKDGWRPEVWAIGLRNPWKYTFDGKGRLIVADVGQNAWEEVGFVVAGGNHGWNVREGRNCFPPGADCSADGFVEPFYQYPHAEGQSVTGGYVAGDGMGALAGKYVFGDFVSGRMWAIDLPDEVPGRVEAPISLGRFAMRIPTFGRDARGQLYVASYGAPDAVYRIEPAR